MAIIPLYNFTLIPYLYDAFKPFLVSHLVLTNETFVFQTMQNDYFNQNYDYYWLSIAKLGQAMVLIIFGFGFVLLTNIVFFILSKIIDKESK